MREKESRKFDLKRAYDFIAIMCFDRYFISALFDGMSRRVF
jgi:hypothetical protein